MRLAPAIALALVLAAPAEAAETLGRSALTAGPVLAGGRVLWADAPSGRPRVLADGAVIASWPAARTRNTGRTVDGRVAAVRDGCAWLGRKRLGCGVEDRVAIAGGRVLFVKGRRLMLGRRVLARGRIAGFDLAPGRAAWAIGPPGGRRRIVLERL